MELNNLVTELRIEITDLKKSFLGISQSLAVSDHWIPRSRVMEFLNYGSTQMAAFEKTTGLIVSKIGKRKFFHKDSLRDLLNRNSTTVGAEK